MEHSAHDYAAHLPRQLLPLIHDYAGDDAMGDREETLKSLATSFFTMQEKPTRIAFNNVTEVLALAREQGFPDGQLNKFLAELQRLLTEH